MTRRQPIGSPKPRSRSASPCSAIPATHAAAASTRQRLTENLDPTLALPNPAEVHRNRSPSARTPQRICGASSPTSPSSKPCARLLNRAARRRLSSSTKAVVTIPDGPVLKLGRRAMSRWRCSGSGSKCPCGRRRPGHQGNAVRCLRGRGREAVPGGPRRACPMVWWAPARGECLISSTSRPSEPGEGHGSSCSTWSGGAGCPHDLGLVLRDRQHARVHAPRGR